jgi:hypothetical protein
MPRKKKEELKEEVVNKKFLELEKKNEVVALEKFCVSATLDNLDDLMLQKEQELVNKLQEYQKLMIVEIKNDYGEVIDTIRKDYNPYLVSTFFFKSINPLSNIEPQYSSEKLAAVWSLYMHFIEQVNINVGPFQPTLSHFAKFAGISTYTLKSYRNSADIQMQTIANKIFDETFDSNVLLAQNKILSNRSTELRVKVENEVQEKPQVKVNVNVNQEVDLNQISARLNEISNFSKAKSKMNQVEVENYGEEN